MATKKQLAALRKARAAKKRKSLNGLTDTLATVKEKATTANPKAVKIVVGVLAAGVTFIIGKKIYNSVKQAIAEKKADKAIGEYPVNWNNVTFPNKEKDASIIALALLGAMDRYLTDNKTIDKYLGDNGIIKTKDDFAAVYQAFGNVGYNQFTGRRNDKHDKLNLTGWLRGELGGNRMKKIEEKLTNDWGFLGGF